MVIFGVLGLAMLFSGVPVVMAIGGIILTAATLGGVAAASMFLRPRAGRLAVRSTSRDLQLPAVPGVQPIIVAWPWLGLLGSALLLASAAAGIDAPRIAGPGSGLVMSVVFLVVLTRRGTRSPVAPSLVLNPRGIVRRGTRDTLTPWKDVAALTVDTAPGVLLRIGRTPPQGESETVTVPLSLLASDPRLVVALIEHYRDHPEHRAELTDGTAVGRIERGELEMPWGVGSPP